MEIRKMRKADVNNAAALAIKTMAQEFKKVGEPFFTKDQYAQKLSEALANMEFAVAIAEKNKLIGFAHWYYADNQAFVEDLIVDPAQKGKGHGKALVNFVLQTCKNDKVQSLSVLMPFGSKGVDFAKKFGIKQVSIELKKKL